MISASRTTRTLPRPRFLSHSPASHVCSCSHYLMSHAIQGGLMSHSTRSRVAVFSRLSAKAAEAPQLPLSHDGATSRRLLKVYVSGAERPSPPDLILSSDSSSGGADLHHDPTKIHHDQGPHQRETSMCGSWDLLADAVSSSPRRTSRPKPRGLLLSTPSPVGYSFAHRGWSKIPRPLFA
jgi:hypothetical protein